jgi:hypothetical protein
MAFSTEVSHFTYAMCTYVCLSLCTEFFSASGKGESGFEFSTEAGSLEFPRGLKKKSTYMLAGKEKRLQNTFWSLWEVLKA